MDRFTYAISIKQQQLICIEHKFIFKVIIESYFKVVSVCVILSHCMALKYCTAFTSLHFQFGPRPWALGHLRPPFSF